MGLRGSEVAGAPSVHGPAVERGVWINAWPTSSDLAQHPRCGARSTANGCTVRPRTAPGAAMRSPSLECIPGAEGAPGKAHRLRHESPAELARRCRGPAHARCVALACAQGGKRLACLQGPNPRVDRAAPGRGWSARRPHAKMGRSSGESPAVGAGPNPARAAPSSTSRLRAPGSPLARVAACDCAVARRSVQLAGGLTRAPRLPGTRKTSMLAERARRPVQSSGEASMERGV